VIHVRHALAFPGAGVDDIQAFGAILQQIRPNDLLAKEFTPITDIRGKQKGAKFSKKV
jgi:hypothetical protein